MYKELENCTLCPRECKVNRNLGEVGFCGGLNQAEVNRIGLHFMEEPIISGSKGSGTVFFTHCTLGCVYCQNFKISRKNSKGKILTPLQLAENYINLEKSGAHNINLVSPTHYMPIICDSIDIARDMGLKIPFVYNTSGFELSKNIEKLKGKINIYLTDLKYVSPYLSARYSKSEDYFDFALDGIKTMVDTTEKIDFADDGTLKSGVIIRHLVLPGQANDSISVLRKIAKHFGDNVFVSLMWQYTPSGNSLPDQLGRTVTDKEYSEVLEEFEFLNLRGFGQEKSAIGNDKVPLWDF